MKKLLATILVVIMVASTTGYMAMAEDDIKIYEMDDTSFSAKSSQPISNTTNVEPTTESIATQPTTNVEPTTESITTEPTTMVQPTQPVTRPIVKVTSITFNKEIAVIPKGKKLTLKANVNPSNAKNKKIKWESSKNNIATVNSKGVVKAKKNGIAFIYAKSTDGSKKLAKCKVYVGDKIKKIKLSTNKKYVIVGKSLVLKATITPKKVAYPKLIWTSSNEKIADVDYNGVVKVKKKGTALITAKSCDGSNRTATYKVTTSDELKDWKKPFVSKEYIANHYNYGERRVTDAIKYIVIHYTGVDGDTDESNSTYFRNAFVEASAHYFVDSDSITQSVPDNYVAWHCGHDIGGRYYHNDCRNYNSIGIEICDDVANGIIYPSEKTLNNALVLTNYLMEKYDVPPENVIRHYDVTHKLCPYYWSGSVVKNQKWENIFKNHLTIPESLPSVEGETVKVNKNSIVLSKKWSDPIGKTSKIVGEIKKDQEVKIIKDCNNGYSKVEYISDKGKTITGYVDNSILENNLLSEYEKIMIYKGAKIRKLNDSQTKLMKKVKTNKNYVFSQISTIKKGKYKNYIFAKMLSNNKNKGQFYYIKM